MVDYYRKIERSVTISADKRSTVDLQVDVWSADANITKFILKLDTADSTAIDLTDATVTTALVYNGVILQDNGQVEEVATQRISYVLNERLRGYEGVVIGGFYVTLKTGQKIDIQNVSFNMRKSLIDTDLEPARENAYATFDTITNDVKGYANTQKSAMLAKTNEVKSYGDTQKTAMNNIVKDVQSTGNTAKTQIGQVLPDVQSKVSAINTELAKVGNKLSGLKIGSRNLWIINKTTTTGVKETLPNNHITGQKKCWRLNNFQKLSFRIEPEFSKRMYGKTFKFSAWVKYENVVKGDNDWNVFNIFKHDLQYKNSVNETITDVDHLTLDFMTGTSDWKKVTYTHTYDRSGFDMLKTSIAFSIESAKSGTAWVTGIQIEEENSEMIGEWTPAPEDVPLLSSPINSILTTLSFENPSTALGGTWTQLGTESKFNQTIYYWKRTN